MTDCQGRNKALEGPWPSPVHQSRLLLTFRPLDRMETADVQYMQRPILANTGTEGQTGLCLMLQVSGPGISLIVPVLWHVGMKMLTYHISIRGKIA